MKVEKNGKQKSGFQFLKKQSKIYLHISVFGRIYTYYMCVSHLIMLCFAKLAKKHRLPCACYNIVSMLWNNFLRSNNFRYFYQILLVITVGTIYTNVLGFILKKKGLMFWIHCIDRSQHEPYALSVYGLPRSPFIGCQQ